MIWRAWREFWAEHRRMECEAEVQAEKKSAWLAEEAQRRLREAKARYGFTPDAGRES